MNFLVTAANGDLGEAVFGVLRDAFPSASIHGTDMDSAWPSKAFFDSVSIVPAGDSPKYLDAINSLVFDHKIDIVVPCSDTEIFTFARASINKKHSFRLIMPNPELVLIFSDKLESAKWLTSNKIPSPRTFVLTAAEPQELPLIIKPRKGSGSGGVIKVTHSSFLAGAKEQFGDSYVAQTYIPGEHNEYTCAVLRTRGEIRKLVMRRRLDAGRTIKATVASLPEIDKMLILLAEAADLDGPLNVQLRVNEKGPQVFEINPRVSSTVKMRHMLGFKDLEWAIRAQYGSNLPEHSINVGASVYRLNRELVLPSC